MHDDTHRDVNAVSQGDGVTIHQPALLEQIVRRIDPSHTLVQSRPLLGGGSAQVALLEVRSAAGDLLHYSVRVHSDRDRARNAHIATHEFTVLRRLYAAGLPVAQPHLLDTRGDLYPLPYLVIDFIPGQTEFAPQNLPDFLEQMAATLAGIHQVKAGLPPEDAQAFDFLPARAPHALGWIGYTPERHDDTLDERRLRERLRAVFPAPQVNPSCVLHGDFWLGNLIWQEGRLVGVIDWEDAELGDPLADLAIARLEVLWAFGQEALDDFMRRYRAHNPGLAYGSLPHWDLFAALRPAGQLAAWVPTWAQHGRTDVTLAELYRAHQWFVEQAVNALGIGDVD